MAQPAQDGIKEKVSTSTFVSKTFVHAIGKYY